MYKLNIIKGLVRLLMEYIYVSEKKMINFPTAVRSDVLKTDI